VTLSVRPPCDEQAIRARAAAPPGARTAPRWALLAAIVGSSMAFIDGTVVSVALPSIQRDFAASATDLQWLVEAYLLFLSAFLLVGGALGDRYGRRRVFGLGVLLFTLASVGCALAQDARQLIVARSIQGLGGALLVPGSLALISVSFAGKERGRAIGTWSAASAITTSLGPLLGGWLIAWSWRWAFLINVPLGVLVLAILVAKVPESRDDEAGNLDVPGTLLATAGLGGVVYGLLEWGRAGGLEPASAVALAGGIAALVAFVFVEARSPHPIVPLPLFRIPSFAGANLLTLFLYGALGSMFFWLPLRLIQVHGYTPLGAGAATLPFAILLSLLSRWSGGLVDTVGGRLPLVVGPLISAAGFALFARGGAEPGASYVRDVLPAVLVLGLGMAITVAPLSTIVMAAVDSRHAGVASGINNAVSRAAGLLAVALVGLLVGWRFEQGLERRLDGLALPPAVRVDVERQRDRLAGLEAPAAATAEERAGIDRAVRESFVEGFRAQAWASALAGLLAALAAFVFVRDGRTRRRPGPAPAP
jgi:EmrB/QacA subfamily drug resistance transporter